MNIVDRRPNPKGKSLSNRQRFLARARVEVKSAVQEALRKRKVADVGHGEKVAIPTRGISEPLFHHNRRTGRSDHVVPGNKEYVRGDEIPRPQGGEGQGGREGSPDGGGEDSFEFTLSKEEFLDMFFEDLDAKIIPVFPLERSITVKGHSVRRRQVPMCPAFSLTDYKVQGSTLTTAVLDLKDNRTAKGQDGHKKYYSTYVQLSRLQSLDGLHLLQKIDIEDLRFRLDNRLLT
jgi:hypothetical protein